MGITCSLYRAPDSTLAALVAQPEFFRDFAMLEEKPFKYEVKPGLLGRLLGRKPRVMQLGHDVLPFPRITEREQLYLDKAWHVLHYLMTGREDESPEPLGFFLSGGQMVGEWTPGDDVQPRVFTAADTMAIAGAMDRITREDLLTRFDWPEMMRRKIYPEIALAEKVPLALWEDYWGQFNHLRDFLRATAELRQGFAITYG
jgi:hypothetical protein